MYLYMLVMQGLLGREELGTAAIWNSAPVRALGPVQVAKSISQVEPAAPIPVPVVPSI
jgi:hypothetical protein